MAIKPPAPRAISTSREWFVAALIFVHYLAYELVFFHHAEFFGPFARIIPIWKSIFPLGLFLYALSGLKRNVDHLIPFWTYTLFFAALLAWIGVATAISTTDYVTLYEWFKFPPRFLFFVALGVLFYSRRFLFIAFAKLLIVWCALAVCQYLVLVLVRGHNFPVVLGGMDAIFAGPFGILGNISSLLYWPGLPFPVPRLCGFWNEPSNASASMFAAFFLARLLHGHEGGRKWRMASIICLVGGLATISNAGYLAIAGATSVGALLTRRLPLPAKILVAVSFVCVGVAAVWGRQYVARNMPHNEVMKLIVGVRQDITGRNADDIDHFSGRVDILSDTIELIRQNPIGTGVVAYSGSTIKNLSASAPIMWFTFGGIFGLALLLARDAIAAVVAATTSAGAPTRVLVCQAWVAVLLQNLSYGDMMGPLYMILVAAMLVGWGRSHTPMFSLVKTGEGQS